MKLRHPIDFLESRPVLAWLLVILYALVIFILSSFPYGPPQPGFLVSYPATLKHILEYSILGFLLLAAFRSNGKTKKFALLLAIIAAGFYGITDEFHQLFIPNRVASLYDILADFIGGFFGAFLTNPKSKKLR